jgi:hypothetical protein
MRLWVGTSAVRLVLTHPRDQRYAAVAKFFLQRVDTGDTIPASLKFWKLDGDSGYPEGRTIEHVASYWKSTPTEVHFNPQTYAQLVDATHAFMRDLGLQSHPWWG